MFNHPCSVQKCVGGTCHLVQFCVPYALNAALQPRGGTSRVNMSASISAKFTSGMRSIFNDFFSHVEINYFMSPNMQIILLNERCLTSPIQLICKCKWGFICDILYGWEKTKRPLNSNTNCCDWLSHIIIHSESPKYHISDKILPCTLCGFIYKGVIYIKAPGAVRRLPSAWQELTQKQSLPSRWNKTPWAQNEMKCIDFPFLSKKKVHSCSPFCNSFLTVFSICLQPNTLMVTHLTPSRLYRKNKIANVASIFKTFNGPNVLHFASSHCFNVPGTVTSQACVWKTLGYYLQGWHSVFL